MMGLFGRSRGDQRLIDNLTNENRMLRAMVSEAKVALREGHWRDPATGRLGKKGELFPFGAAAILEIQLEDER